jgi:phosphatidylserine/phosphatidylglycerophosphate/cardiolipin synthase-like enzyme
VFEDLAHTRGVEIRVKRENSAFMHLKSYEIDGQLLRTGAANFSASGLKRQDNDLIVIKDVQAAAKFKHVFEARFASLGLCAREWPARSDRWWCWTRPAPRDSQGFQKGHEILVLLP